MDVPATIEANQTPVWDILGDVPKFQDEMTASIQENVDHIKRMIAQQQAAAPA